ncbi:cell division protein FtsA [Breznakia sp. PF5-3]|uniref:hypothetical protein n=1 Tax=unclassified Breznakia TaxID=2623764 RepID=UPI0024058776|nr:MULTISPECIES: hypothetical protein [unclassified Breznakia]MDF9825589.1 cell division protein FtsA [Breznakia sp. PM6-1]MDF9836420.1 cell division protein FtsA [Breznakia sp. PF5-3]MDF9838572.1 cell division protein FtsA [Breznakia sp. PFB2-8]MDF9860581.1 cell division protein FtsA [Breznakia sp. PH5-24]
MQAKQYYASIELAEDELRLIVGEFFMSRFNVLKVERVKTSGIKNKEIIDQDSVSASVVKALYDVEKTLGFKIRSIILCIPSQKVKCVKRRVNVPIEEGSKRIRASHARIGVEKAIDTFYLENYEFVNIGSIKYTNGGISSRTIPLDEQADVLTMDIDFICVDQQTVYSYVTCIEAAGISVQDICLDNYAIAEESAIFESSMEKYMVLLNCEKTNTDLSLFYKGRLLGCESLNYGYNRFVEAIRRKYHLSYKESLDLLKESAIYAPKDLNDSIVYIWAERDEHKKVTRKEIYEAIDEELNNWIHEINDANELIAQNESSKMLISGSGADIIGMNVICDHFSIDTSVYLPTTIGVRKGCYSATLGAIFCHKKWQALLNTDDTNIEYSATNDRQVKKEDENAFTKKLKNILLNR